MLKSVVRSSRIGSHSPEQQVNQKWPYRDVTSPVTTETKADSTEGIKVADDITCMGKSKQCVIETSDEPIVAMMVEPMKHRTCIALKSPIPLRIRF